jgi:hypothetical protein
MGCRSQYCSLICVEHAFLNRAQNCLKHAHNNHASLVLNANPNNTNSFYLSSADCRCSGGSNEGTSSGALRHLLHAARGEGLLWNVPSPTELEKVPEGRMRSLNPLHQPGRPIFLWHCRHTIAGWLGLRKWRPCIFVCRASQELRRCATLLRRA